MLEFKVNFKIKVNWPVIRAKNIIFASVLLVGDLTLQFVTFNHNSVGVRRALVLLFYVQAIGVHVSFVSWVKSYFFFMVPIKSFLRSSFVKLVIFFNFVLGIFEVLKIFRVSIFESRVQITQNNTKISRCIRFNLNFTTTNTFHYTSHLI